MSLWLRANGSWGQGAREAAQPPLWGRAPEQGSQCDGRASRPCVGWEGVSGGLETSQERLPSSQQPAHHQSLSVSAGRQLRRMTCRFCWQSIFPQAGAESSSSSCCFPGQGCGPVNRTVGQGGVLLPSPHRHPLWDPVCKAQGGLASRLS